MDTRNQWFSKVPFMGSRLIIKPSAEIDDPPFPVLLNSKKQITVEIRIIINGWNDDLRAGIILEKPILKGSSFVAKGISFLGPVGATSSIPSLKTDVPLFHCPVYARQKCSRSEEKQTNNTIRFILCNSI